MRAAVCQDLSEDLSGLQMASVPAPDPRPGEVRIKVEAASVNYPDLLLCQGKYQLKLEPPFVPGLDFAGTVEALGDGVTEWSVGDAVAGGVRHGAFAEYVVSPAATLQSKPDEMSFEMASAFQAAYLTAYVALARRGNLQSGETLLVHGASGGVGLAAVDVGRLLGATVIAASGSQEKRVKLEAYGADHVIDPAPGFRHRVKALTGGRGADVIFDPVGGDIFDESARCIAFGGRLLVIGFTSGRIATISSNIPLIKGFSVVGVRAGEYGRQYPQKGVEILGTIWGWAREGKTRPVIDSVLPLEKARDALLTLQQRGVFGKIVLKQ